MAIAKAHTKLSLNYPPSRPSTTPSSTSRKPPTSSYPLTPSKLTWSPMTRTYDSRPQAILLIQAQAHLLRRALLKTLRSLIPKTPSLFDLHTSSHFNQVVFFEPLSPSQRKLRRIEISFASTAFGIGKNDIQYKGIAERENWIRVVLHPIDRALLSQPRSLFLTFSITPPHSSMLAFLPPNFRPR